jgi:hypothetical protein
MRKSLIVLALLSTAGLAGCMQQGINANCAGLGLAAGAAAGMATNNNVAQSALAGGVLGAVAGDAGMCN